MQDGCQCGRPAAVIGVLPHHVAVAPFLHAFHLLLQQCASSTAAKRRRPPAPMHRPATAGGQQAYRETVADHHVLQQQEGACPKGRRNRGSREPGHWRTAGWCAYSPLPPPPPVLGWATARARLLACRLPVPAATFTPMLPEAPEKALPDKADVLVALTFTSAWC